MKKTLLLILVIVAALVASGQQWQYCEVTSYVTGTKFKTIANMDTIAPPAGIENESSQKWDNNTVWLNKFGSDRWELVSAVSFSAGAGAIPTRYTFRRELKE